jgi:hypothetical protein
LEASHLTFFSWLHHLTIHLRGQVSRLLCDDDSMCHHEYSVMSVPWYQLREPRSHMNSNTIASSDTNKSIGSSSIMVHFL